MAVSRELSEFLQDNLDKVQAPSSYAALRQKLMNSKLAHPPSAIKQSPENSLKIENITIKSDDI
jgi:hypothetical protein